MARQSRSPRAASARATRRTTVAQAFDALTVEGALIATAQLALVADAQADQDEAAYGVPRGLTLRDEIPRYFRIGQALWNDLAASEATSHAATVSFTENFLRDVLGFADVAHAPLREYDGRVHPVTLEALGGRVPIVVVPPSDPLDRPSAVLSGAGRRTSAALALQDWLNAADEALWGLACNGEKLRLVRDNPSLTRPAYIEADLRRMFEGDAFADFTALWLLLHVSRFGPATAAVTDCPLERWRDAGQKAGVAARDRLRDGVEEALRALGTGFLSHLGNGELRRKLETKELDLLEFHGLLLRLVYRLIFLLAAEDRNLLHPPSAPAGARALYAEGYSISRLRSQSAKRSAWDAHDDLWDGLQIAFHSLARGEPSLGLSALAGLFTYGGLGALEDCALPNRALMRAIYRLAWLKDGGAVVPVNWRDMETEELGSVYESLLELTPRLSDDGRGYGFAEGAETKGNQRKTTGSYYTPDSLVQILLDSALDPVLDRVERESETPADALLSVTVIDPACGSGHFLLAAARRIATRVARHRSGGAASAEDYRHALRDVVRNCIHGVDRNPMAVELTKVALWIETVEPGRPLGFLDANIRCGDALFGVFDLAALDFGVPDDAYKPLSGDDPQAARVAGRVNRDQRERAGQGDLVAGLAARDLAEEAKAVLAMSEDDANAVNRKAAAYDRLRAQAGWGSKKVACDLYVAAFLRKKQFRNDGLARAQTPDRVPTTLDVRMALANRQLDPHLAALAVELAEEARAFHWPLEFPAAMATTGFDVVLGNPPWERIKLQEQEFFAPRDPEIAAALNTAARSRLIAGLEQAPPGTQQRALFDRFEQTKRSSEAASVFARVPGEVGGRFPFTGRGDVNTYALFTELFAELSGSRGRAGLIVPTGIATDATTAPFFAALVREHRLVSLHDFQTGLGFFDRIGHARFKFALLTLTAAGSGPTELAFSFFSRTSEEFADKRRHFVLTSQEIAAINPNTKTAPVFRTRVDADLTAKIYERVPVLIEERRAAAGNPWGLSFMAMFHMSNDSGLFRTAEQLEVQGLERHGADWVRPRGDQAERWVPLYEAKMVHQFDHRWATYDGADSRDVAFAEKQDPNFEPMARYWVPEANVKTGLAPKELGSQAWHQDWLIGWRDIARSTDERTCIFSAIPRVAVAHTFPLLFSTRAPLEQAVLLANLSSLVLDYVARQKVGGTHLTYGYLNQFAVLPPSAYSALDLKHIGGRVLELTFTSKALGSFARDLGYEGPPFAWNEDRRAQLRAELDAWYARAYGLTRDELRYILDPADVTVSDFPSETFRVLREKEVRRYGEYRTQRLVLEAWDAQDATHRIPVRVPITMAARYHPSSRRASEWSRPTTEIAALQLQTRAQIAAVLKALSGPTPEREARLGALYALEPNLLTARLAGGERRQWITAVGNEANPPSLGVLTFALGGATGWADALRQLRAQNALIVDTANNTWAPGPGLVDYYTDGWPERAGFALDVAARILATDELNQEETRGSAALAA